VNKKSPLDSTKIQWAGDDWIFTRQITGGSSTCSFLYANGFGLSITNPSRREKPAALAKPCRGE
jgi:hypothetical protein